ncbi:MAG: hypothetical protein JEY94_01710 [Melioribacteraceae bacterium]|nr:hypothetical protein [Melioribacteraceae bacterium]
MSWDCPNKVDEKCTLNKCDCKPAAGKCVLVGRYEIAGSRKESKKESGSLKDLSKGK